MSLTEYIYVDGKRLDSYAEQLGNPVVYDRIPVWKAGLSLTGPSADAQQTRPARPLTQHEKVQRLRDHVAAEEYPRGAFLELDRTFLPFRVPSQKLGEVPTRALHGWLTATGGDEDYDVIVLADSPDEDPDYAPSASTAYSAYMALLDETGASPYGMFGRDCPRDLRRLGAREALAALKATFGAPRECWMIVRLRASGGRSAFAYPIVVAESSRAHLQEP